MKLINYDKTELYRGTILRFKGKYPFAEEMVDFMICEYPQSEGYFALYCISGYHAGQIEYIFPKESNSEKSRSIKTEWIIKNWNTLIYKDCPVNEIEIII